MATKKLPRDMGFFRFWGESLKRCFSLGWVAFGVASTAMPAGITLIQHWYPALAAVPLFKTVSEYQAEIQVGIALTVLVAYLSYAPFKLYKEANDDAKKRMRDAEENVEQLESAQKSIIENSNARTTKEGVEKFRLEQRIGELQSQLDRKSECRRMALKLGQVMERGRQLLRGYVKGTSDWQALNDWTTNDVNPVLTELGIIYIARFNAAPQTVTGVSLLGIPEDRSEGYLVQASRMRALEEFIKELTLP